MSFGSSSSLKSAQLHAIHKMLAFHEDLPQVTGMSSHHKNDDDDDYHLPPAGSSHNQWKILIYDEACRSIISPLMSVSQLRKRGVTLHLLLNNSTTTEREPIPDVPAIYFCMPTAQNLKWIASDCSKGLYQKVHLNFCTKLDRSLMEDFARLVVQSGSLDCIASVHDLYLDYVCLEQHLFSLHKSNSYVLYNSPTTTEQNMEDCMTQIAYGLFSVVASLNYVPIIRCPKAGAPEMVARKLHRMIAEHPTLLRATKSSQNTRPLLVLFDRNADLVTPIQHSSTYQALIDDLLQHSSNRVEFAVSNNNNDNNNSKNKKHKSVVKKYDLDPDQDSFYAQHKFQPFPEAIESNGIELQQVTQKEQQIRSRGDSTATTSAGAHGLDMSSSNNANELATAVDSLPALLDRKKQLEVHTSILQAVMAQVAARDVPQFYELESSLATGYYKKDLTQAKQKVMELATDPTKGSVQDKVRLVMVYMLATTAKIADVDEVAMAMKEALDTKGLANNDTGERELLDKSSKEQLAVGMRAFQYIKQLRTMHMLPTATDLQEMVASEDSAGNPDMLSSFMARATTQASGFLAKATEKMGTMLGKIHKHRATQVVENLCEMKPNSEDQEYLYLDPKVKDDVDVNALRNMTRAPVREVIAFVIGGGCYAEYQNLQMVADERRRVSYGSTELLDPSDFMAQLAQLG